MKQHITREQWNELSILKKRIFWRKPFEIKDLNKNGEITNLPNIGQMIEFLRDDLNMLDLLYGGRWSVDTNFSCSCGDGLMSFEKSRLCDALWEAIKYKLKTTA